MRRTIPAMWVLAIILIAVAVLVAIAWRPLTEPTTDLQLPTLVVVP